MTDAIKRPSNEAVATAMRGLEFLVYDAERFARVFDAFLVFEIEAGKMSGQEGCTLTEEQVGNLLFLSNRVRIAALNLDKAYDLARQGECPA